jgi:hypothetical protein
MAEHPLQRKIADALRLPSTHRVGWGIGQKKAAEKVQDPPPAHFLWTEPGGCHFPGEFILTTSTSVS